MNSISLFRWSFFLAVTRTSLVFSLLIASATSAYADYSKHPLTDAFVKKMVDEHGFADADVRDILKQGVKQQSILDAISRPAEKTKEWFQYRDIFIQEKRIAQGVEFWRDHADIIQRASEKFNVAPQIIVSIIGVETRYGRHAGRYRVLDALTTLGFDYPKRGKFFRGQLEQFLLMIKEQKLDPLALKGSYAGAMGYGQFIPGSYRAYAVDFDDDDVVDIWANPADAIGSVANYFRQHRWREGQPVFGRLRIDKEYDEDLLNKKTKPKFTLSELKEKGFTPVDTEMAGDLRAQPLMYVGDHGKEFWFGYHNFYVITRYNRSHLYAMAVWQLSEEIKTRYEAAKPKDA